MMARTRGDVCPLAAGVYEPVLAVRLLTPAFASAPAASRARTVSILAFAGGEQQRRQTAAGVRLDVCSRLDQRRDRVGVVLGGGPHQCRLVAPRLGGVDVSAACEQAFDDRNPTGPGRPHQDRLTLRRRAVRVRAGIEECADDRRVAALGGQGERRDAVAVRSVRVGAAREQAFDNRPMRAARRPVQRRRPVRGGGARVGVLVEQRLDPCGVTRLHRLDQGRVDRCSGGSGRDRGEQQPGGERQGETVRPTARGAHGASSLPSSMERLTGRAMLPRQPAVDNTTERAYKEGL